jgi:hypothetical protein
VLFTTAFVWRITFRFAMNLYIFLRIYIFS